MTRESGTEAHAAPSEENVPVSPARPAFPVISLASSVDSENPVEEPMPPRIWLPMRTRTVRRWTAAGIRTAANVKCGR